jgi:hypothetical protein
MTFHSRSTRSGEKRALSPQGSKKPSPRTRTKTMRIANKLQLLAIKRPNMLHVLETFIDGMLANRRSGDPTDDDPENGRE